MKKKNWTWCPDSKIVKPVWLTRFETFIIIDIFALSGKSNKPMLEKSKKNISKQDENKTTADLFKMRRQDGRIGVRITIHYSNSHIKTRKQKY